MSLVAKTIKWLFILGSVAVAVAGGSLYLWWRTVYSAVDIGNHQKILVVVPEGASATEVGKILWKSGVIRDPFVFRVASHFRSKAAVIMPGDYLLSRDENLGQIFDVLEKGPLDVWVTIPEGWRREQIAQRLETSLNQSGKRVFDGGRFVTLTAGLEGQLFPDTYLIPQNTSEEGVAKMMLDNFTKRTNSVLVPPFPLGLTKREVIVLASIVERETSADREERSIVAGILLKRLKNGWGLQADATLQYIRDSMEFSQNGLGAVEFWKPVGGSGTSVVSPYNTYLNNGLPPGAIANPGLSAIGAVLLPKETNYWFYLHGADGKIHFAKTDEEQQQNVGRYL